LRGLEVVAGLFQLGQYMKAVIVSSEISSIGLNSSDPHTYPLFGDGAVAVLVEPSTKSYLEKVLFKSFGDHASSTMVRGGGTLIAPQSASSSDYYFEMKGSLVLKQSLRKAGAFIQEMLGGERTIEDIDWIVPHQPSGIGLRAMERFFAKEKMLISLEEYGNCISASMLLSLEKGISSGQIRRGDRLLLIGTGAGLSLGAALLVY
jgi:3-oxoacyl-[acyl-carrier-protein] synthase-3